MPAGRPTVMTPEVLGKLEDAYLSDATHLEAAIYAGIAEDTLHDYRKKNPKFSERIDGIRGLTGLQAKINVRKAVESEGKVEFNAEGKAIRKGVSKSQWYLERRDEDFNPKQKQEHSGKVGLTLLEQIRADREKE